MKVSRFGMFGFGAALALAGCSRAVRLSSVHAAAPESTLRVAPTPPAPEVRRSEPVFVSRAPRFDSRTDSLEWARARRVAERATGYRLVVSLQDRRLWAIRGADTVLNAPAAVAMGTTLQYAGRKWTFKLPRGVRTVLRKKVQPVWTPPDWLYAETARENGLLLGYLPAARPVTLKDGRRLVVRKGLAGVILPGSTRFNPLPTDEHIVFDNKLYVPPLGSQNRRVEGELGPYGLDLGEGYLLHGTPHKTTIGTASTHGCVRLRDEDITWLYENVPVGTKVYVY